jgi:hypothetical protein
MKSPLVRRVLAALTTVVGVLGASLLAPPNVRGGTWHPDPAQLVPLDKIAAEYRGEISDVITYHTFHRQGAPDSFPCNPQLYLCLLNEPALTLALWQDISTSPVQLRQVGADRYQGSYTSSTTGTWDYVYRSPRLHVLLSHINYAGPPANVKLDGRIVLIVHSDYFRRGQAEHWVRHDVDMYLKVDSKGWRALAKTARPVIEKLLEEQVQEAGWFVSLMGRLVEMYPNWACQVAQQGPEIRPELRQSFQALVTQTKRPGAFTGRPIFVENTEPSTATKMR